MPVENVTLTDRAAGSSAQILAGLGFNCYSFQTTHDGVPLEALWALPEFSSGTQRPSSSGIPILFPYPGRIQGRTLAWEGKEYSLPAGDRLGNAMHGFVHTRAWRVLERSDQRVVGQFQASLDDARILEQWPADFRITATYELAGNTLKSSFVCENPDDHPLPCGLGTHPYFRVPLGGNDAEQCRARLPVSESWQLDGMLATGVRVPLDGAAAYHDGLRLADMKFDNVFGDIQRIDGVALASVADPVSGRVVTMTFNDVFRACVVFNPPHRGAVCIEPYTCVPDPYRLQRMGIDAGLRVLAPGESFTATVEIRVD